MSDRGRGFTSPLHLEVESRLDACFLERFFCRIIKTLRIDKSQCSRELSITRDFELLGILKRTIVGQRSLLGVILGAARLNAGASDVSSPR